MLSLRDRTDVGIVVRSAGERTASACVSILREQLPQAPLHVVQEYPFERALLATFEWAASQHTTWTLSVDADVLFGGDGVGALLRGADAMPSHYLQVQARIADKVTGEYRIAGQRVYRTDLLTGLAAHVPPPGRQIRPEGYVIDRMAALGHPSRLLPDVVALHDYEQFYADLYRKALVHARKHSWMLSVMFDRCVAGMSVDPDFRVVLRGLVDGLLWEGSISIDKRKFEAASQRALQDLGLVEKPQLTVGPDISRQAEALLQRAIQQQPVPGLPVLDHPGGRFDDVRQRLARASARIARRGLLRGLVGTTGAALRALAARLDP
jgi:hypothetical protein